MTQNITEEQNRIKELFSAECGKNLKEYGGAYASYEFEHKIALNNTK